jgi:protein-disulfide isomerase/uncharacterized membrane protein
MAKHERGTLIPLGLVVVATLQLVLGVVQWMELLLAQATGDTFCKVNSTLDCAAVWASPLAKALHAYTRVPVAGWGVIWALGALAAGLAVVRQGLRGQSADRPGTVARLFAVAGVGASVGFFALSIATGALCLTCLSTYALCFVYAGFAFKQQLDRPLAEQAPAPALAWSAGLVVVGYLLVLYPGTQTPTESTERAKLAEAAEKAVAAPPTAPTRSAGSPAPAAGTPGTAATAGQPAPAPAGSRLARFLGELNPHTQQALADALAEVRAAPTPDVSAFPRRLLHGDPASPVRIVDFSDIRCGHCAQLAFTSEELRRLAPDGAFSEETRWFPLDAECNSKLDPQMTDGSGVRCAGARALICLEDDPNYTKARLALFQAQAELSSTETILSLASDASGRSKAELAECMRSPETEAKLQADIEYASVYKLEGTPLVVINGRKVPAVGPLLFALILAEGRLEHPDFGILPPARGAQ